MTIPGKKISQFPDGGAVQDTDQFVIARAGQNYSILGSVIGGGYGTKQVWNSATGYSIEAGQRVVNGSVLEWTSSITRSSLSLANSTFYYVYLYSNSGTPAVEESTTAPAWNSTYRYWQKTGDATRRMVGALRTDGSGDIYRFHVAQLGNVVEYIYESGANSAAPFMLVNSVASTGSWTSIDLTGMCAANAVQWYCAPKIVFTTAGDDGILSVIPVDMGSTTAGSGSFTIRSQASATGAQRFFSGRIWINIVTALTSYYRTANLTGAITAVIEIHGFKFVL